MRTRDKLALGAIAAVGASWGARAFLRSRRWIELRDRVVVITGSDSGFGLIQARQVAAQGAIVVLAARDAAKLEAAADAVRAEGAREVLAVPTDVSKPEDAARLIERTVQKFGKVDVLINTAGLMIVGAEPALTLDDYRSLMDVNFWGAVHTTRAVLPHMRKARFGRIGNVSSVGGLFAIPHMLPYATSKFALTGYTKGLRPEALRDNIYVTGHLPLHDPHRGAQARLFQGESGGGIFLVLAGRHSPDHLHLGREGGESRDLRHPGGRPGSHPRPRGQGQNRHGRAHPQLVGRDHGPLRARPTRARQSRRAGRARQGHPRQDRRFHQPNGPRPRQGVKPSSTLTGSPLLFKIWGTKETRLVPIYEYRCEPCDQEFETLVRTSGDVPHCPSCGTIDVTKQFSVPAAAKVQGGGSSSSLPMAGPMPGQCGMGGCGRCE